jgi:tetratricopeptide (TPR) repeat protein
LIPLVLRRLVLAAWIAAALLAFAGPSLAQDDPRERSRAAFRRGVSQAHEGNYAAARDAFLEAYKIFPHPSILLNLGIARAHTGQWVEAEQDLVHFLADDGGAQPDELSSARAELAQTRSHLGTFRLRVSPDGARATIDGKPIALIPGAFVDVRTTRGVHGLSLEADAYEPATSKVDVEAERAPNVDLSLTPVGAPATAPGARPADRRRTLGGFLLGGGIVAAAVGVYAGAQAISLANQYNTKSNTNYQDPATKARGVTFRTSADVAFVAALAMGGVGLYFLFAPPPPLASSSSSAPQAGLVLGPGFGGIAGSF